MEIIDPQKVKPTGIPFTHGPCEVCGKDSPVRTSPLGYPGTVVLCGKHFVTHFLLRYIPLYFALLALAGVVLVIVFEVKRRVKP